MSKFRKSAKGQSCTLESWLQWEGGHDPETVVLAHAPHPDKGRGIKGPDIHGGFCCVHCHDWLDRRTSLDAENFTRLMEMFCTSHERVMRDLMWGIAIRETQRRWIAMGLLPND